MTAAPRKPNGEADLMREAIKQLSAFENADKAFHLTGAVIITGEEFGLSETEILLRIVKKLANAHGKDGVFKLLYLISQSFLSKEDLEFFDGLFS